MAFETGRNPVSIKNVCKLITKNKWTTIEEILKYHFNAKSYTLQYSLGSYLPPVMPTILANQFASIKLKIDPIKSAFSINKAKKLE